MTEQWQELKETITEMRDNDGTGTQQEICKFLVNYMDVLEKQMQEPCEDAVSRQWLMRKATERFYITNYFNHITKMIEEAPSVKPQPKTGHWNCGDDMFEYAICSSCKHETGEAWEYAKRNFKYCPNCGAKMVEPQERSDKE